MMHLRKSALSLSLHSPSGVPASHVSLLVSHHRFFSAATPIAPNPFAIDDYLVANCGLSRAEALKASKKLSHLKSPSNPDAVVAFLAGLGLVRSDVATVVARYPRLLCGDVGKTLAPRVVELGDLGLSRAEIFRR
uniref:Uncharacterized protein n=1 Tax=Arundo donax TaxID=35708 RepID=A0A0A9GF29_ARUDO